MIKTIKAKIGMRSDAECFSLYEITGNASGKYNTDLLIHLLMFQ